MHVMKDGMLIKVPAIPIPAPCPRGNVELPWRFDVGGMPGNGGPCATKAIAIATGLDRALVDREVDRWHGSRERSSKGIRSDVVDDFLRSIGWLYHELRAQSGDPCVAHVSDLVGRQATLIVRLREHMTTLVDGVVVDTFNVTDLRFRTPQCVLGYWQNHRSNP